jgi:hypothetical protein
MNAGVTQTRVRIIALSICCVAAAHNRTGAQITGMAGATGVHFQSFTFASPDSVNIKRVSLLTIPVAARAQLAHNVDLSVDAAFATATLTRPGGPPEKLSGLTDTDVRLTYSLAADRVRLSAIGLLPTGKSELTAVEMDLAGVVAADLLPFAISHWGSGGGLGMNAAFALPLNETTSFGVSGGYVVAREYSPLSQSTFAYRPGNQLQFRGVADRTFGSSAKASLQVTYMHFGQDQSAGANLYQAGDRLQGVGSLAFATGATGTGIVYLGYLRRQRGEYTSVVTMTPAQDLVYGGTAFRQPVGRAVLVPSIEIRVLGNEAGLDQGGNISGGAELELNVGRLVLVPSARVGFGTLTVSAGQKSGYANFEAGFTVRSRSSPQ